MSEMSDDALEVMYTRDAEDHADRARDEHDELQRLRDGIRAIAERHEKADLWVPYEVVPRREVSKELRALLGG